MSSILVTIPEMSRSYPSEERIRGHVIAVADLQHRDRAVRQALCKSSLI
jgi:hypothetical protein